MSRSILNGTDGGVSKRSRSLLILCWNLLTTPSAPLRNGIFLWRRSLPSLERRGISPLPAPESAHPEICDVFAASHEILKRCRRRVGAEGHAENNPSLALSQRRYGVIHVSAFEKNKRVRLCGDGYFDSIFPDAQLCRRFSLAAVCID